MMRNFRALPEHMEPARNDRRPAARALHLDSRPSEAAFNRALALERLSLAAPAITAWEGFQQMEPSRSWRAEAKANRTRLAQTAALCRGGTGAAWQEADGIHVRLDRLSAQDDELRFPISTRLVGSRELGFNGNGDILAMLESKQLVL